MGDKSGVRVRSDSSIEIDFYYRNVRCRERIKINPTPKNIAYCTKLKARIEHEIATGEFDYKKHFPESLRAKLFSKMPGDALLIEDYLESWLAMEKDNIRYSTFVGYTKILKYHLVPVFGKGLGEGFQIHRRARLG